MSISDRFEKNVVLAPFTTFKIGGPAKLFVEANTKEELIEAIRWAKQESQAYFILGGGSNIVVNDKGFDGLVIKNDSRMMTLDGDVIEAESGAPFSLVVDMAKRHGLSGLEWAAGLPGTVGGAVRGNAGAFGFEISKNVAEVSIYDYETDQVRELPIQEANFKYRSSDFKTKPWVMLSVKLKLKASSTNEVEAKMSENIRYRIEHQPAFPSAGSVFKNFTEEKIKETSQELYLLAKEEGVIRGGMIGAGWIIDKIHLKGKAMGGAMVSLEHGNFIINQSQKAKAEEVLMLISFIKQQVRLLYGVHLHEEVQYVGF